MMEDIRSRIYDTNSNFEIGKDFEKFSEIGSPRSIGSVNTLSFRDLTNESYNDYIRKIKNVKKIKFRNSQLIDKIIIRGMILIRL
jgi:hypothetical protein